MYFIRFLLFGMVAAETNGGCRNRQAARNFPYEDFSWADRASRRLSPMSQIDQSGRSALHYASAEGDVARVRELIESGDDPNLPDQQGATPLHLAAQEQCLEAVSLLLEAEAAVDAQDQHGNSPLFTAVFNSCGDGSVIALLRAAGADPWLVNRHGQSPLGLARLIANYDIARFFDDLPF
jgi:ankyrin repeat protein